MKLNTQQMDFKDSWAVAEGSHNGKPLIIRYRQDLDENLGRNNYPHLMKVSWTLQAPNNDGLPNKIEVENLNRFESFLVNEIELDFRSIVTVVITTCGKREWYIYTNDVDAFSAKFHQLPQEQDRYPIEILLTRDEKWEFYNNTGVDIGIS